MKDPCLLGISNVGKSSLFDLPTNMLKFRFSVRLNYSRNFCNYLS